jgi:hypothetical protein
LHGVVGADLSLRLERQRADVLAVGRVGDPCEQYPTVRVGRGGEEAACALERRGGDGEELWGLFGDRPTIATWSACS